MYKRQDQYFGTEIEMTGITRQRAAEVVAEMFGTEAYYDGTTYGVWSDVYKRQRYYWHSRAGKVFIH